MDPSPSPASRFHPDCFACSHFNPTGLHLSCRKRPDGTMAGEIVLDARFEGYPGTAHGGIVATLLDSAMAQCLFAEGRRAVTGDLQVRFRQPVHLGVPIGVQAWIVESSPPLFRLQAELRQGSRTVAVGRGVFVDPEDPLVPEAPVDPGHELDDNSSGKTGRE